MRTGIVAVGLLLRVQEKGRDNIAQGGCVVSSSSNTNATSVKRSGLYPRLSQSTEPPSPVAFHRDLCQGEGDLRSRSFCH